MIIVKIIGGLGNQMFQYAYAKALEQKGYKVKIDISAFETYTLHGGYHLNLYNIDLETTSKEENAQYYRNNLIYRILKKLNMENSKVIREKKLLFDKSLLDIKDDHYLDGYFQCEKYFQNMRNIILKQFVVNPEMSNYTKQIEKQIKSFNNSCSLHIRRGDFINNANISIHGTCDIEYYKSAIIYLEKKFKNINYFIFSDDIEWVKENLPIENAIFVKSKEKRIPHEDIYLMSLCSYNVIANSSFSWWGAWLNQNDKKVVVAPKRWFADDKMQKQSKDIVCENWVRL